jgi:hypothetical protein
LVLQQTGKQLLAWRSLTTWDHPRRTLSCRDRSSLLLAAFLSRLTTQDTCRSERGKLILTTTVMSTEASQKV